MELIDRLAAHPFGAAWFVAAVVVVGVAALPWTGGELAESSAAFRQLGALITSAGRTAVSGVWSLVVAGAVPRARHAVGVVRAR